MRGRQKGQTKRMSKIKDSIISPYEIWIEEDQFTLVDTLKNKPLGYYSDLGGVIKKISRLGLANQQEDFTLKEFVKKFNNIQNQLTKPFKNI